MTLEIPVQGNTPVLFSTWEARWSIHDFVLTGESNFTLDPRQYSGVIWVENQKFLYGHTPEESPPVFSITYTVDYEIPALGASGSTQTTFQCT